MAYSIRTATTADIDVLVDFTLREAYEAEGAALDLTEVRRGVSRALEDPAVARYWVAATPGRAVVASASIVTEWSNFRGGHYWWVQSLFVHPEHRGAGLVDQLLDHLARAAAAGDALELRLYAHEANARARRAYERCGFSRAPYLVMRRPLRPDRGSG